MVKPPPPGQGRESFDPFTTGTGTYSHQDISYVRKKRRAKVNLEDPAEEDGELNIVPYLDIIVNLIIFLLVMQAAFISVGMIDVTAPSYASVAPGDAQKSETPDLRLTLGIAQDGFYIAASGGVLPGEQAEEAPKELTADNVSQRPPTVPLNPDGSYDFKTLAKKLRTIKAAFPETESIYIAADNNIPYSLIVETLDTSREDAKGELFPAVAFTQID